MVSSRFELVAAPAMQPAEDLVTRSTVGPFVDTGAWTIPGPQRRRIYLSVDTIRELAEVAGVSPAAGATDQQLAHAYAMGALDTLKENLGGDLARVLVRLAHHLDLSDSGDGVAADEPNGEDVGSGYAAGLHRYLSGVWSEQRAAAAAEQADGAPVG